MTVRQTQARSSETERIIDAALDIIARTGLDGLTLRDLAQSIGKSTTVIVNAFGSKVGLIDAVSETALEQDRAFHHAFFSRLQQLPPGRDALVGLILAYLQARTAPGARWARVGEALILAHDLSDKRRAFIQRWDALRVQAWQDFFAQDPALRAFAPFLCGFLLMEQYYGAALAGRSDYGAIQAESVGAMVDRALGRPDEEAASTDWFTNRLVIPHAPAEGLEVDSMKLRLLNIAADQMLGRGINAVTNRSVSLEAETSTSTIAHHWGDMKQFLMDAIWHSVFREMPPYLDHRRLGRAGPPIDAEGWSALIAPTLDPRDGFYVKYARLIAQICLKARLDPAFQDLAMILRGPEGGGTYTNRADVWPETFDLTRLAASRFAIWIKGQALIVSATQQPYSVQQLQDAARMLVHTRSEKIEHTL